MDLHVDNIKKAYKSVVADGANKTSLILYSGGVEGEYRCRQYQGCMCYYPWLYHRSFYRYNKEGCLYFGDNDLNQANILNDLKHKLGSLVERVGTIQVPHHGAINNFNDDIFTINNLNGELGTNAIDVKKHIYNYLVTDSKIEIEFAKNVVCL